MGLAQAPAPPQWLDGLELELTELDLIADLDPEWLRPLPRRLVVGSL